MIMYHLCRDPRDLDVDLSSRNFIVTGANAGLGRSTAEALAKRKASVHMLCRSAERGAAAQAEIKALTGNQDVHLHVVDIGDTEQVKRFASSWGDKQVHALVCNAGVLLQERQTNSKGFEMGFATMANQSYLLTGLLLPNLAAAQPAPGRVVHVSSGGGLTVLCDVGDLQCERRKYDGTLQYAHVKRAQIMLSDWWAKALPSQAHLTPAQVVSHAMHPGWAGTEGVKTSIKDFYEKNKDTLRSSEQGADTIVWLAAAQAPAAPATTTGGFWFDRAHAQRHFTLAGTTSSEGDVERMLQECERCTGVTRAEIMAKVAKK
jgi:dehydrogenase/reductase SDR family protein 12